jgi:hypothetical protein
MSARMRQLPALPLLYAMRASMSQRQIGRLTGVDIEAP